MMAGGIGFFTGAARWEVAFTIAYPRGNEIRDQAYRLVDDPKLSRDHLREATREMSRLYR
jgi:hypothetical protein